MIVGAAAERPVIFALALLDWKIVDAGDAQPHQSVFVELAVPLARQERFNGLAALQKLGAIAPAAVDRIRKRDACRFAGVPGILGHARLLRCGLDGERGKRWSAHAQAPANCFIGWRTDDA